MYHDCLLLISALTPTRRTYHTLGGPIPIAPSENSVGKDNGQDDTCVAAKANTIMFQCDSECEVAGKEKGLVVERGCRPVLSSSPKLIYPQRSSENPTAVFVIHTL